MTAPNLPWLALADLLPTATAATAATPTATAATPTAPVPVAPPSPVAPPTSVVLAALPASDPGSAESPPDPEPIPASDDARRVACAILEVLAGVRSISDTAVVLGVSPARYYQLEARALQGLVQACEPRAPGPLAGAGLVAEVAQLRAERDRLKAEAARYQALARLAHGAFGAPLTTASAPPPVGGTSGLPGSVGQRARRAAVVAATRISPAARTRKKRTPTVRALRLAARVQGTAPPTSRGGASTPPAQPATPPRGQPGG